jgi:DNA-binding IclR family transcriptional regulator
MNILDLQRKILEFCFIARTSSEIAEMLELKRNKIYPLLKNLVKCRKLNKKGDDKRRANLAFFTIAVLAPPVVIDDNKTNNFHAHNPFGL